MYMYISLSVPTTINACLYSVTSQTERSRWPPQQTSAPPDAIARAGRAASVPRGQRHAELGGTVRRRLAVCAIWAGQTSGLAAHPADVGD